jgi:hypothetical protein
MSHTTARSRVLLVEDRPSRPPGASAPKVRRFRLARLELNPRGAPDGDRFAHLKRSYD